MTATPIYDAMLARPTDPLTSHEAAAQADLAGSRSYVLDLLKWNGPLADWEIWSAAVAERNQYPFAPKYTSSRLRTARAELVDLGLVAKTDRVSVTPTGRHACVWAVIPEAVAA